MGPRLKTLDQYRDVPQTASIMTPQWEMLRNCKEFHEHASENALYLCTITNPKAHLTLNTKVNSLEAVILVDSEATRVFMHPNFAQDRKAKIRFKEVPQEVQVIDGRIINFGLITHEAIFKLRIGNH